MKLLIVYLCFITFFIQNCNSTNTTKIYTKEYLRLIRDKKNNETIHKYAQSISDDIVKSAYNGHNGYYWEDKYLQFTKIMIDRCILELRNTFIDIQITSGKHDTYNLTYYIYFDWN